MRADEADEDDQVTLLRAIAARLDGITMLLNTLALAHGALPRELCSIDEAAAVLGVSRVTMYDLIRRREVQTQPIGARGQRVNVASLKAFAHRGLAEERGQLVAPAPAPSRVRRARRPAMRKAG